MTPTMALCSACGAPASGGAHPPLKRPGVVTLLAVMQMIGGTLGVLLGLFAIGTGALPGADQLQGAVVGVLLLCLGIPQLACGLGLWQLRPWGRVLQIVLAAIGLLAFPIGTILSALILWLFLKPGAQALFSGKAAHELTPQESADAAALGRSGLATAVSVIVIVALLAVPLVGILAAIAVPSLMRARMSGNEASAIGSLRTVNSAQATFAATCGNGYYAADLAGLAVPGEAGGVPFISADLSMDPTTKSGYTITLVAGAPPADAPESCNGARVVTSYFVSAEPLQPGTTGARYFATNTTGEVFEATKSIPDTQDGQPAGATPLR